MDMSKWYQKMKSYEAWTVEEIKEFNSDMRDKKKEYKKLVKNEFKEIRDKYGFFYKGSTHLIRVTDKDILHIIYFDTLSTSFRCGVAIQPLYAFDHTQVLSRSMGDTLNRLDSTMPDGWDYDYLEENLKRAKELLLKRGIPWFARYGSPEGIIDFILRGQYTFNRDYAFHLFSTFSQNQYLAFSFLYIGRIAEGIKFLEETADEITENATDLLKKYKSDILNIADTLRRDPGKAPELLSQFIAENKKALKQ